MGITFSAANGVLEGVRGLLYAYSASSSVARRPVYLEAVDRCVGEAERIAGSDSFELRVVRSRNGEPGPRLTASPPPSSAQLPASVPSSPCLYESLQLRSALTEKLEQALQDYADEHAAARERGESGVPYLTPAFMQRRVNDAVSCLLLAQLVHHALDEADPTVNDDSAAASIPPEDTQTNGPISVSVPDDNVSTAQPPQSGGGMKSFFKKAAHWKHHPNQPSDDKHHLDEGNAQKTNANQTSSSKKDDNHDSHEEHALDSKAKQASLKASSAPEEKPLHHDEPIQDQDHDEKTEEERRRRAARKLERERREAVEAAAASEVLHACREAFVAHDRALTDEKREMLQRRMRDEQQQHAFEASVRELEAPRT